MTILNSIFNNIFDWLFFPFLNVHPWITMLLVSLLTGLLMLFIFKHTSNQEGIRRTKDRIKAHLLEMRLYKESFVTSLRAQGNILTANIQYMGHSIKPLLVMIIPVLLILIQLNFWFGYRPLKLGENTLLKVQMTDTIDPLETDTFLEVPPGIKIETPPLRIQEKHEIDWRLSPTAPGVHEVFINIGPHRLSKKIYAGNKSFQKISPLRPGKSFFQVLLYPVEKPLPEGQTVKSIEVLQPTRGLPFLGLNVHWLIAFFALSIIFGFSLKGFFGVEI